MEFISCEMGLVRFLSTVSGDYLLLDQIVVLIAEIHGSTAATFCNLPGAEKQEAISEYFLINTRNIIFRMSYDTCFHRYSLLNPRTMSVLQQLMVIWLPVQ